MRRPWLIGVRSCKIVLSSLDLIGKCRVSRQHRCAYGQISTEFPVKVVSSYIDVSLCWYRFERNLLHGGDLDCLILHIYMI